MNTVFTYLKGVERELKQTTFPNRDFTFYYTVFVVVFSILMASYFAALDLGFAEMLKNYLQIFAK